MKKLLSIILLSLLLIFCACQKNTENNDQPNVDNPPAPTIEYDKKESIVVVGDSLLDFWDNCENFLSTYYKTVENVAILATHVLDWQDPTRNNYAKILKNNPAEVMIGLGINDIKNAGNITTCTNLLKTLISNLKQDSPNLVIHIVSVEKCSAANFYRTKIEEWNDVMRTYAQDNGYYFIDYQDLFVTGLNDQQKPIYDLSCFLDDQLHYNELGYSKVEEVYAKHFGAYVPIKNK